MISKISNNVKYLNRFDLVGNSACVSDFRQFYSRQFYFTYISVSSIYNKTLKQIKFQTKTTVSFS